MAAVTNVANLFNTLSVEFGGNGLRWKAHTGNALAPTVMLQQRVPTRPCPNETSRLIRWDASSRMQQRRNGRLSGLKYLLAP
jgi:hypothetical protein